MDHFALPPVQPGAHWRADGTLHSSGYTEAHARPCSAMGVTRFPKPTCFRAKSLYPVYERKPGRGPLPTLRRHLLNRKTGSCANGQILVFMTRFEVELTPDGRSTRRCS